MLSSPVSGGNAQVSAVYSDGSAGYGNYNAVYAQLTLRDCVLGFDTNCGATGNIRMLPWWNLDATVSKDIGIWKGGG
jgi:hypothetical protein